MKFVDPHLGAQMVHMQVEQGPYLEKITLEKILIYRLELYLHIQAREFQANAVGICEIYGKGVGEQMKQRNIDQQGAVVLQACRFAETMEYLSCFSF